jgi:hypothetical protein
VAAARGGGKGGLGSGIVTSLGQQQRIEWRGRALRGVARDISSTGVVKARLGINEAAANAEADNEAEGALGPPGPPPRRPSGLD